jgi:hypothetical protein
VCKFAAHNQQTSRSQHCNWSNTADFYLANGDGVLLIRPDKHIGWRSMTLSPTQNKPSAKP